MTHATEANETLPAAPQPTNPMAELVGPHYYDTHGAAAVLTRPGRRPVSTQAVHGRRRRHTILALRTTDNGWVYPSWQFTGHTVLPGLADVLTAFFVAASTTSTGQRSTCKVEPFSAWSVSTWLMTSRADLADLSAVQWLQAGHDREHLIDVARRTVAALDA